MAHPFRYFRKHQKAFLAVAAVVAMFVFVIGDQITAFMGQAGGGRSPREVIATWKGGKLTYMELENLTQRRFLISEFLNRLRMTGAQRLIEEGGNPMMPSVPDFVLTKDSTAQDVQIGVINTRILADQAKKSGITISDEVINHFLKETSFRRVSDQEILALLQGIRGGDPRGLEEMLFAGLRELLLGRTYMRNFTSTIQSVLPEQRWEDWRRINERISLEVATLPVRDFVKDVPEPTEAELLAFYEQYKNVEPHVPHSVMGAILPSADPGFKIPRKVRLSYLLGDVNAWSAKYRDSITDEEIADYYERNKRTMFVKSGGSTAEFDEELFDSDPGESADEDTSNETPASEIPEDDAEESPPAAETPAEESQSPAEPSEEDASSTEPPAPETSEGNPEDSPSAETPADESEAPAEPAEEDSGNTSRSRKFKLAAFQADPSAEAENADEALEEVVDEEEMVEEAESEIVEAEIAAEEGIAEPEVSEEPEEAESESETADEEISDDAPPSEEAATDVEFDSVEEETEETDDTTEYEPLENVKDTIRTKLATDKAVQELGKTMDRVLAELQSEYNPYSYEVISARTEKKEIPEPPTALTNLKERAAETRLASEETVLLSQRELADTFVGKAIDSQTKSKLVLQAAFGDLKLYEPFLAEDLDGNSYLVTKVEDVPEKVPTFEEVRADVEKAWKLREAAQLALKKAEEFAAAAEKSGDRLSTFFIGKPYDTLTTDLFSWYTFGTTPADMQRGPKLGEAPPLEAVGPDFMIKAFELEEDDVAALLNYDQTDAFVFRLDRRELTPEELRNLFLKETNNWYGGQVMMQIRMMQQQQEILEEIIERSGLDQEKLREFFRPRTEEE